MGFTRWRVLRCRVTTDASLRHLSPVTYPPVAVSPTPGVTQHFRNFCVPAVHEARAGEWGDARREGGVGRRTNQFGFCCHPRPWRRGPALLLQSCSTTRALGSRRIGV